MSNCSKTEFDVVKEFTAILKLPNQTDGSLYIYQSKENKSKKPDGYYYYEGVTFILDAKAPGEPFTGQLEDYMELESNENFVGFKYDGKSKFECYINGKLIKNELILQNKDYYIQKYFGNKKSNEIIVSKIAKELADLFRGSKINYQNNVPFIGAVFLCLRYNQIIDTNSTETVLNTLSIGLDNIIIFGNDNINRTQKKEYLKTILKEPTLVKAKIGDIILILSKINSIYNFINISSTDYKGHDIMNAFLRIFRRWNSANAKQKGEVFTPDHIAKLMYKLAKCSKDNVILDPACGSGTFLTNAMVEMFSETNDINEHKKIKENRVIGIEVDDFNATLSGINMLLHGDGCSNISCVDCFTELPKRPNTYDRVLMNPPFSQSSDPELKFVYHALNNMKEDGILASVLPKSCVRIGNYDKTNYDYMQKILKISNVISVVSLPNETFYPIAPATCIIVLQKTNKKHTGDTLLIDLSDDGFVIKSDARVDNGNWNNIYNEILDTYINKKYTEYRAIKKTFVYNDIFNDSNDLTELLFEAYSSHRSMDIEDIVFARYLRENIASKILCGKKLNTNPIISKKIQPYKYDNFIISDIIEKVEKGKEKKSIDRKLEDKYDLNGIPLIVAKKDNNGIGGMISNPTKTYKDKICIISGGDGGGGKTYYCDFEFCATGFAMICDFKEEYKTLDKYSKFYISVILSERLYKTIGHGRTISEVPNNINIKLPININGKIDKDYMSNFIKSLPFAEYL